MKINTIKITGYLIIVIFAALFLAPFYIMIVGSLKMNNAFASIPPDIVPSNFTLENYLYIFSRNNSIGWYFNSFFISIIITSIVILIDSCAAYSFAKKQFLGKKIFFTLLLTTMMIPKQVLIVPMFIVLKNLNLYDNLFGVILSSAAVPFGVFLLKQYIQTLPNELIDSGKIDGCPEITLYTRIILPLSKPALGALAIFTFIGSWNDYMWQMILISSREKWTVPMAMATMTAEKITFYTYQMAGAMLASIPMIIVFISFQRFFVKGITLGAVKG